jgi:hypothetical protein
MDRGSTKNPGKKKKMNDSSVRSQSLLPYLIAVHLMITNKCAVPQELRLIKEDDLRKIRSGNLFAV